MLRSLHILWKFSRPHTIIGSIISICTLWLLALPSVEYTQHILLLLSTLVVGVACNIFIVGLNQIIDIDLDKINKPQLPLAEGSLSLRYANAIIYISLVISLTLAFYTSLVLGWLIIIICLIGIAYSVPPIQLKRHHLPAALSITVVRGVLVNIGMFIHFKYATGQILLSDWLIRPLDYLPAPLLVLTGFVIAFSVAIAWFKDLPDTKGDAQFEFKTLAILYSPKFALWVGSGLVFLAYVFAILWAMQSGNSYLLYCHLIAWILFMVNVFKVDINVPTSVTRFYMIFWVFFFAEYLFFASWSFLH
jgi:homogentisate phytyltransferase / homogentisate geranylgeranyltransferase